MFVLSSQCAEKFDCRKNIFYAHSYCSANFERKAVLRKKIMSKSAQKGGAASCLILRRCKRRLKSVPAHSAARSLHTKLAQNCKLARREISSECRRLHGIGVQQINSVCTKRARCKPRGDYVKGSGAYCVCIGQVGGGVSRGARRPLVAFTREPDCQPIWQVES